MARAVSTLALLAACADAQPLMPVRHHSEVTGVDNWPSLAGKFPLSYGIKASGVIYASGMQGADMTTFKPVEGGIKAETQKALENVQEIMGGAGGSMKDVLRCSVSLRSMADFAAMNEVYATFWPSDPPARVAVEVPGLVGNASVEIQCDGALSDSERRVVKVPGWPDLSKKFPLSFATSYGGTVYLSGSQGMDIKTGKLVSDDVGKQTTQTLLNLKEVVEAAGSGVDHITECTVSLVNISDFDAMNAAYKAFFQEHGKSGVLPSRVSSEIGTLAGSAKVEIMCTATDASQANTVVKVPGWPDTPGLPFSAGVRTSDVVYVSGNQGVDMKTGKLVAGGAGPETTQTLMNINATIQAAGSKLEEVLKCEVSLTDLKDFAAMNKAYAAFWQEEPPARVAVHVGALARGATVEIRCLAAAILDAAKGQAPELVVI